MLPGLPWWSSGWESSYSAGDFGSTSWSGKIPTCPPGQLSLCTTTAEAQPREPAAREAAAVRGPHTTTEKAHTATKAPHGHK